jgi:hypothetical protein
MTRNMRPYVVGRFALEVVEVDPAHSVRVG